MVQVKLDFGINRLILFLKFKAFSLLFDIIFFKACRGRFKTLVWTKGLFLGV